MDRMLARLKGYKRSHSADLPLSKLLLTTLM